MRLTVFTLIIALLSNFPARAADAPRPPNLVIILADDLGYGDLGCYGHPSIRTPNLDRMAAEGMRFTDFYASAVVCTPSRAGLLTGRYAVRAGLASDKRRVFFPNSANGLPATEITIADLLRKQGYATAQIGKWHLGHHPQHLPLAHGFDYQFGLPYSNDMDLRKEAPKLASRNLDPQIEWWNQPLLQNGKTIEQPVDQHTLTKRYTEEAIKFIRQNKDKPFFVYLAHTFPHVPLFASKDFQKRSPRGLYGDVVEELDWSTGQVLDALRSEGLAENTLVIFNSDNGPWLMQEVVGGSAGLLKEGKGSTWEGGMRVPCIAWWPGRIRPGQMTHALACNLDFLPTACALAGAEPPKDRVIDGVDLLPLLRGAASTARDSFIYYRDEQLYAARKGPWKIHVMTKSGYGPDPVEKHDPPLLYDLDQDPSERFDVAAQHADVVAELLKELERHRAGVAPVASLLDAVEPKRKPAPAR
jgi:arylsulfatase A